MGRAEEIYKKIESRINLHKGKVIAIDEESGDYFIGDTEIDAYDKAAEKHPNRKFIFKRIGFKHTYFVGAF